MILDVFPAVSSPLPLSLCLVHPTLRMSCGGDQPAPVFVLFQLRLFNGTDVWNIWQLGGIGGQWALMVEK